MRRVLALGLWLCLTWAAAGGSAEASTSETLQAAQTCCKTCHAGKACGNSCISREKQCHQPPGCACDG